MYSAKKKTPEPITERTCFNCKETKPLKDMTLMGIWACNDCLTKSDKNGKRKK